MSTSGNTHHIKDQESFNEGMRMIVDRLAPLMPKISSDDIEQATIKLHSQPFELQLQDIQVRNIVKTYLGTLNIYFQRCDPKYMNDPHRGPMQIEITGMTPGKSIFYCPQCKDGKVKIATNEFARAMEVLSKPEALLLFQ